MRPRRRDPAVSVAAVQAAAIASERKRRGNRSCRMKESEDRGAVPGTAGAAQDRTPGAARFGHRERAEIENKTPITPPAVFEVVRRAGEQELVRPTTALVASGLVAGLAIGFSVLAKALLHAHMPDTDWRPLVTSLGYSVGFVIVIMGQMQLFTENTITVVCPLLVRPSMAVLGGVARLWALVLGANLAGAAVFGVSLYLAREAQPETWQAVLDLSRTSISHDFRAICIRGIGAGWLIAALVWIISTADEAQLILIVLVTYVISLAGFSHVVAGGVEAAVLVMVREMSVAEALLGFVTPAVLGNVIGGTVLFTLLTWAQIRAEL